MQITKVDALISAPRYFSSSCDIRRNSRRSARSSRVRTRSAHVREAWGNLGRTRRPVVPRYSVQVAVIGPALDRPTARGPAVPESRRDPAGWVGRRGAGGIDRDGTVTAAIPPRSPLRRGADLARAPGRRDVVGPPARDAASVTSSSCAFRIPPSVCPRLARKAGEHRFGRARRSSPRIHAFRRCRHRVTNSSCARCTPFWSSGRRASGRSGPARTFAQLRCLRSRSPRAVVHPRARSRRGRGSVPVVCDPPVGVVRADVR